MASIIYLIEKEKFKQIVAESKTFTEILKKCNLQMKGSNINTVKRRIAKENLDFSHIKTGFDHNKGRLFIQQRVSLEECLKYYFIENSKYQRTFLIKLIKRYNLINYKCSECGCKDIWNSKKISLQLDHINGISDDNRLENLRFLCPNCHSQTSTYAGKSHKKRYFCNICNKEKSKLSINCNECSRKINRNIKTISEG